MPPDGNGRAWNNTNPPATQPRGIGVKKTRRAPCDIPLKVGTAAAVYRLMQPCIVYTVVTTFRTIARSCGALLLVSLPLTAQDNGCATNAAPDSRFRVSASRWQKALVSVTDGRCALSLW